MILQSLVKYYESLLQKPLEEQPPSLGWSDEKVSFALELSPDGKLVDILVLEQEIEVIVKKTVHSRKDKGKSTAGTSTIVKETKKKIIVPQTQRLPLTMSRTSKPIPGFVGDNAEYVLGVGKSKAKPLKVKERFDACRDLHFALLENAKSKTANAILSFFQNWDQSTASQNPIVLQHIKRLVKASNIVFFIDGEFAHDNPEIKQIWNEYYAKERSDDVYGLCLVTGKRGRLTNLHKVIQGVEGAQSSGASLISFNDESSESYGKIQGENAPISEYASFASMTALKMLLSDYDHKIVLGDTTIVYWSESGNQKARDIVTPMWKSTAARSSAESDSESDDDDKSTAEEDNPNADYDDDSDSISDTEAKLHTLMSQIENGEKIDGVDLEEDFYILGLAPSGGRIAIRFFYRSSFGNILKNSKLHYDRINIIHDEKARDFIEPMSLVREMGKPKTTGKQLTSILAGELFQSIVKGTPYHPMIVNAVMQRIKAEQDNTEKKTYKITRGRVALIKAYQLSRNNINKEVPTVNLNPDRSDVGYILGRIFALLENCQYAALGKLNKTIKDAYFGLALTTPAKIFPKLFDRSVHHIRKAEYGYTYENEWAALLDRIDNIPLRLNDFEQQAFVLGYYQQRTSGFNAAKEAKKAKQAAEANAEAN